MADIHSPGTVVAFADPCSETRLVTRARGGDEDALSELYALHAQPAYALAWRLTSDRTAAEDITQDAFLRLLDRPSRLDPARPVRPWLLRIVSNLAIDRMRRRWRELPEDAALESVSADALPDAHAEALGLLVRLQPHARALVWLHLMEGWSHPELARRFGRSESWSKSIVHRALATLRSLIDEESS